MQAKEQTAQSVGKSWPSSGYGLAFRSSEVGAGNITWGWKLYRPNAKKIKISMISLGGESVPDVEIALARRYAIVEVTNSNMTAQIGP